MVVVDLVGLVATATEEGLVVAVVVGREEVEEEVGHHHLVEIAMVLVWWSFECLVKFKCVLLFLTCALKARVAKVTGAVPSLPAAT